MDETERGKDSRLVTGIAGGAIVVLGALLAASLALLSPAEGGGERDSSAAEPPAHVEAIEGSDVSRVTLTRRAAERIDLQTEAAQGRRVGGRQRTVIPYAALVYDADGRTWAYVSSRPLVFRRAAVSVEDIRGERVVLDRGPRPGTRVVVVGAQELLGAELGVGH